MVILKSHFSQGIWKYWHNQNKSNDREYLVEKYLKKNKTPQRSNHSNPSATLHYPVGALVINLQPSNTR